MAGIKEDRAVEGKISKLMTKIDSLKDRFGRTEVNPEIDNLKEKIKKLKSETRIPKDPSKEAAERQDKARVTLRGGGICKKGMNKKAIGRNS